MRHCLLTLGALILAGCAGQPIHQAPATPAPAVAVPAPAPPTAPQDSAPADAAPAAMPAAAVSAQAPAPAATAPADAPGDPPASTTLLEQSPDLFVRLRRGFKLEDVDDPAVDRELNWYANNPDYLERVFARAGLYLHYIVGQLELRGMPREIALLPVVESAFEPYAYSRARAAGLWQFIPGTGSRYGLRQDWWYDGRRDVIEATRAALDYLQELHDEFNGDWLLAIAAYNCGEAGVARAVSHNQRNGVLADFWHLKLPRETRAYVPKLLAMSRLVANPADYGLEFSAIPDVAYFAQVKTGSQASLQVVAELAGISKDELYELNPAYHRWATDPAGPHMLLVPATVSDGLEDALAKLTPEQRLGIRTYTVRPGDTLASLADQYKTSARALRELNGMSDHALLSVASSIRVPSSEIQLPAKAARAAALVDRRGDRIIRGGVHVVRRGDTLSSIARRMGTDVRTLARLNNMRVGDTIRAGQRLVVSARAPRGRASATRLASAGGGRQISYTVRRGDTLYSIARVLQVTMSELLSWNGISSGSVIKPGQRLIAFVNTRG